MKIQKYVVLFSLILLHAVPGFSQTRLSGFVEYDNITYWKNVNEQKINARNQSLFQLELRHQANPNVDIFGSVEIRNDQADPGRDRIYLDEAYINLYLGNFDFRIGKQIIIWGKADGINPTDNITPWDFSDILDTDDERIGVVALKTNYYVGNWTLEGIVVPTFTSSVLPLENSRWFPTFPEKVPNPMYPAASPLSLKAFYEFQQPLLPDENFDKAQYAGKLSTTLSGWDVSVNYYYGWDDLPAFHQTQTLNSDSLFVRIQSEYHRRKAAGGDFSTTFGKWGIRGEAAYYFTADPKGKDPEVDDPYFQYVIGIDRTFSDLIGDNNLFVLIQWIQEIPKSDVEYRNDDLNHIFQKSITARLEYELGTFSKIIMEGVYNFKNKDYYLRPNFTYNIADGVEMNVLGYILDGSADSFFGSFHDNKRIQMKLKYSF